MMPACKRLLAGCAVACLLLLPAAARAADEPPDPFAQYPVLQHGNLHVHTAISSSPEDHAKAQKIWETLNEADEIGLDFVGLADHAEALADEHFLVTRGTAAVHPEQTGRDVIGLPGFELTQGGIVSDMGRKTYDVLHLNVFGSEHYGQVQNQNVKWPVLRIGRFLPNPPYGDANTHWITRLREKLRAPVLSPLALLHPTRLHEQIVNYSLDLWSTRALRLQLPNAGRESDQFSDNAVDTAWGYRLDPHPSALDLARNLRADALAETRQVELKALEKMTALLLLGPLAGPPGGVLEIFEESRESLVQRLSGARTGGPHTLALPPVIPEDNPHLGADSREANERIGHIYAEYYTLLWRGLHLWDRAPVPSSANSLKSQLEAHRHDWWTKKKDVVLVPKAGVAPEDAMYAWLESYAGKGPVAAQFNHPNAGLATALAFRKFSGQHHFGLGSDSATPARNSNLWKRVCLMEIAANQDSRDHETGPLPTSYSGVAIQLPFYNLALANQWRLAPSAGIDNNGWLKANAMGLESPRARQSYVGTWLQGVPTGDSAGRMQAVLDAFRGRRTYVSENPHLQLKFSAVAVNPGGAYGGSAVMGQDLVARSGRSRGTADFLLELGAEGEREFKVRNDDITLVEVRALGDRKPSEMDKLLSEVDMHHLDRLTRDTSVLSTGAASPGFRQRMIQEVLEWATSALPAERYPDQFLGRDPQGNRLGAGERRFGPGRPLRIRGSRPFRKFSPSSGDKVLCVYAVVRFREDGKSWYAVSAPLWMTADESYAALD